MPLYRLDGVSPDCVADRVFIAPGAQVIGKVRLAEDTSVWFNAVLRGDSDWITIGARSNVQDGCILHVDPGFPLEVGPDCTIGHGVILHGCTIREGTLIGMGATVLNGAKVGRNCIVGAKALITEGKEFPDNSLIVGAPARIARTLDEAQAAMGRTGAQHYRARARIYAERLETVS